MEDPITNDDTGKKNQDNVDKDDHVGHVDDEDNDDTSFLSFLQTVFQSDPLRPTYPELFAAAPNCIVQWRRRFLHQHHRPDIWRRLFDIDKIRKEFSESAPVLDAVLRLVHDIPTNCGTKTFTIIDLASGKGYLSMILSELLPPEKIHRIVLMDKAWPMRNQSQPGPHHINWEHIYIDSNNNNDKNTGNNNNDDENNNDCDDDSDEKKEIEKQEVPLFCQEISDDQPGLSSSSSNSRESTSTNWPIQLDTSKQDLKHSRQLANIHKYYLSSPDHPVIILAIHLCGTLSLRAVQLFNGIGNGIGNAAADDDDGESDANPRNHVHFLALKPCCLPGMVHAKRKEQFVVGNHSFPATDVCTHGKWKKKQWMGGPPRGHLKDKFQRWAHHLYLGIDTGGDEGGGSGSECDDGNVTITTKNHDDSYASDEDEGPETTSEGVLRGAHETSTKTYKVHSRVIVQHKGGFQNDFLFAERRPISSTMWQALQKTEVIESNIPFARTVA